MSISRAGAGVAAVALASLAVLGTSSPASAAPVPPGGPKCPTGQHYKPGGGCVANGMSLEHRNMNPGGKNSVQVVGFKVGSTVTLKMGKTTLATFGVPKNTVATSGFTVPAKTKPGTYTVTASGTSQNGKAASLSRSLQVVRSGGTTTATFVATPVAAESRTADTLALGALGAAGVLLLGAGPTAVLVGRRRRTEA